MSLVAVIVLIPLVACGSVHPEDLNAWVGVTVSALDKHPIFLTMPVVRTVAVDGTEIRNYVNGRNIASCSGGGSIFGAPVSLAAYSTFANCVQAFPACNNIFYLKSGVVTQFTPIGSSGMRCYTDERLRPGGAAQGANYR